MQRILQISVPDGRSKIVARQQKLRHHFFPEEQLLVGMHQQALTHSRAGLHPGHTRRPLAQSQIQHSGRNRP